MRSSLQDFHFPNFRLDAITSSISRETYHRVIPKARIQNTTIQASYKVDFQDLPIAVTEVITKMTTTIVMFSNIQGKLIVISRRQQNLNETVQVECTIYNINFFQMTSG